MATLPPGDDPDSFVRREGADALRAIIDAAKPWYQHVFEGADEALADAPTPEQRAIAVRRLVPVVRAMVDPVIRAHYRRRLSELGQVDETEVRELLGESVTHSEHAEAQMGAAASGWVTL